MALNHLELKKKLKLKFKFKLKFKKIITERYLIFMLSNNKLWTFYINME